MNSDSTNRSNQDKETLAKGLNPVANAPDSEAIDLLELLTAFRRRKKILFIVAAVVFILFGLRTLHQRKYSPLYTGSFTLLITDPISTESPSNTLSKGISFDSIARNATSSDFPTLVDYLKSQLILSELSNKHSLGGLGGMIGIRRGGGASQRAKGVLVVTLSINDPEKGQVVLEDLSKTYLRASLQNRQKRLQDGLAFLSDQAPALRAKTKKLESDLTKFREDNGIISPKDEAQTIKTEQLSIEREIMFLESENQLLKDLRESVKKGAITPTGYRKQVSDVDMNDAGQGLLTQMVEIERELAAARTTYTESSSVIKDLEARLKALEPILKPKQLASITTAISLNTDKINIKKKELRLNKNKFSLQPDLIRQYEELTARLKLSQENLVSLNAAKETFQLEMAQTSVPWRILSPPSMGTVPIKPSIPRNLLMGAMIAFASGVAASLLRDRIDYVYHNPEELEKELGLPILGNIPYVDIFKGIRESKSSILEELDNKKGIEDYDTPEEFRRLNSIRFFYQEAFRNFYTSIRFLNSDIPLKSIAITSSMPSEGKTFVNILTAKTLSDMGQRILLIDADMRKPQLHFRLGMNNIRGLSNLLTDSNLNIEDVIQEVPQNPNISIITAGTKPPDPTRLLGSESMKIFNSELVNSDKYDLILYDTPPIVGLADASLVAEKTDGMILLVSLSGVSRDLPKEAINKIQSSRCALLGLVANAIKKDTGYGSSKAYGAYNTAYLYEAYGDDDELPENLEKEEKLIGLFNKSTLDNIENPYAKKLIEYSKKSFEFVLDKSNRFMKWLDT